MGAVFAPTYATLVMGYIEISFYKEIDKNYGAKIKNMVEENWMRYLDDCFFIIEENIFIPRDLLEILNNLDNDIKFTMETNTEKLAFLDVMVNIENDKIWMDTYSKPLNDMSLVPSKTYLEKYSSEFGTSYMYDSGKK